MPAQSTHWPFDLAVAQSLGFFFLGIGGSRAYEQQNSFTEDDSRDWDLIGMVRSKEDIISIVLHNASQLNALLGITTVERVPWEILDNRNNDDWEVLRYAGWDENSSKRSLKIWSQAHLSRIMALDSPARFGVLCARAVRHFRRCQPPRRNNLIVYQPIRLSKSLYILFDTDLIHSEGETALNPGVTCDLFLTCSALYDITPNFSNKLIAEILQKWKTLSKSQDVLSLIPLLYRQDDFVYEYRQHLQTKFIQAIDSSPHCDDQFPCYSESVPERASGDKRDYYHVSFFPVGPGFWTDQGLSTHYTETATTNERPIEYRPSTEQHHPTPFTSNCKGAFGEVRLMNSPWQNVFVKAGAHVTQEISNLPDVRRHFPQHSIQELIAVDIAAGKVFFKRFKGKTLSERKLDFYVNRTASDDVIPMSTADWFLDIELRRAEHVTDSYRSTININHNTADIENQPIHRFYYERLKSDSRFMDFYSETIPFICDDYEVSASDFLKTPLVINGEPCRPLRHYLDLAQDILNPHSKGGLRDLPIAFGLGDGHGGNIMVKDSSIPAEFIHIDYEVAGFHCPLLDMAKAIYNDGFFTVLYGDLLCDNITDQPNMSGTTLSWSWSRKVLSIDYDINIDQIGTIAAITKLEYILRPVLELISQDSSKKAQIAEAVLASALLSCALLTRNYSKRPDVFFLNLAIGVQLASDMRRVFRRVFGWTMPMDNIFCRSFAPVEDNNVVEWSPQDNSTMILQDIISLISSSCLVPDEVFLKRASETFGLQRRFSQASDESSSVVLRRIGHVRYLAMKVAPHTCIRESIFAEPRIDHHFAYKHVLDSRVRTDLLVDVGCCMGSDIRKLVLDGYCPKHVLGLDIENRFFDLGQLLYNEGQQSPKIKFRQADLIDINFAKRNSDLSKRFQFVHTANVLHLFSIKEQDTFFRNLVFLAKPGGIIWGRQVGLAPDYDPGYKQPEGKGARFTATEFRDWCLKITGWDAAAANFEAQLVEYNEIRLKRPDKRWVLQWKICVPVAESYITSSFE